MPKTKLTPEELKKYFNGQKKYMFYDEAVKAAKELRVHANKEYPKALIEERRPSEGQAIFDYRKKIYKSQTKGPIQKVIGELMKIRKSDDWSVLYTHEPPKNIRKGEEPRRYWEERFPKFRSLTNWTFTVLLKSYLIEPNSVILVMPIETPKKQAGKSADFRKPFPFWFDTESVIESKEEELFILKSKDKATYTENGKEMTDGDIFYVVTDTQVIKYKQTTHNREFAATDTWDHNLGYVPAFKVGGQFLKAQEDYYMFESRISAMVDHLDEAAREYSDLQAEVVQHVHSEKWVLDTQSCQVCNGTGKERQGQPVEIVPCQQCKGSGSVATSPYLNIVIKRAKVGEQQWTGDPAGYIKKPTEIVEIQDRRIDKHIYKALATVSMEFLAEVPLAESGKAKEVDRDALNTFVNSVAEDLVYCMDRTYRIGNDIRYMDLIADEEEREALAPKVAVPTKYDILSTNYLVDEVKKLRDGKVNPLIISYAEIELANKKFSNNPEVREQLACIFDLDPVPGIDDDAKTSRLQNKGITIEDYVISCNIQTLVQMAFDADKEFAKKKLPEKQAKILELAKPKIEQAKIKIDITDPSQDPKEDPKEPADPNNPDPTKKPPFPTKK